MKGAEYCGVNSTSSSRQARGEPLAAEDQARLFQEFTRLGRGHPAVKGVPGTGLGLSIVKHIVGLHGGEVSLRSEPGAGSAFRIELPRA